VIITVVLGLILVSSGKKRHSKKKQRIMYDQEPEKKTKHVELGDRCSWNMGVDPETGKHKVTDHDVIFVCPKGSSCVWVILLHIQRYIILENFYSKMC